MSQNPRDTIIVRQNNRDRIIYLDNIADIDVTPEVTTIYIRYSKHLEITDSVLAKKVVETLINGVRDEEDETKHIISPLINTRLIFEEGPGKSETDEQVDNLLEPKLEPEDYPVKEDSAWYRGSIGGKEETNE